MRRQGVTYDKLEEKSGVLRSTFKAWRTSNRPGLETIEAALGALGWSALPVPTNPSSLPDGLRADLEALAAKHCLDGLPCLSLITACVGYKLDPARPA